MTIFICMVGILVACAILWYIEESIKSICDRVELNESTLENIQYRLDRISEDIDRLYGELYEQQDKRD